MKYAILKRHLVACGLLAVGLLGLVTMGRAVDPDNLLYGPDGDAGADGASGASGVAPVLNPMGLGVDCASNGVTLGRDERGLMFSCLASGDHHLELRATSDGEVATIPRPAPTFSAPATVVLSGSAGVVGLHVEHRSGTALQAGGKIDLNPSNQSFVRLPLTTVSNNCSCSSPCGCAALCPAGYRAIGGGCRTGSVLPASHCYATAAGCIDSPSLTPERIWCGISAAGSVDLDVYAICLAESAP